MLCNRVVIIIALCSADNKRLWYVDAPEMRRGRTFGTFVRHFVSRDLSSGQLIFTRSAFERI